MAFIKVTTCNELMSKHFQNVFSDENNIVSN